MQFVFIFFLCFSVQEVYAADATSWIFPVGEKYSVGYEYLEDTGKTYGCSSKVYHPGSDMNTGSGDSDRGTPVYSIANGEVVSGYQSNWGTVIIKHKFGEKEFYSLYGHLDSVKDDIVDGAEVVVGQVIGQMGDRSEGESNETCYRKDGSSYDCMAVHLHFEIREDDHSYPEDGNKWCSGLINKSTTDMEDEYSNPKKFIQSDGYIDGSCAVQSSDFGSGVFCWFASEGEDNVSCEDGIGHKHYSRSGNGSVASQWGFDSGTLQDYCDNLVSGPVDIVRYLTDSTYNPGGSDSGGGSGNADLEPNPGTPWDGYDHDVGMDYVKLCEDKDDNCYSSMRLERGNLPVWDVRTKLKRKGGVWKDVEVDSYCSALDRNFELDDFYLGAEDKRLTKSKYDDKDKKSVYLRNVPLDQCIQTEGKHYLFSVIHYEGGMNPSTETSGEEHVRLEVIPPVALETNHVGIVRQRSVVEGGKFRLGAYVWNPTDKKSADFYKLRFSIFENEKWRHLGSKNLDAGDFTPQGSGVWKETGDDFTAPKKAGLYLIRACIANKPDSCSMGELKVYPKPKPDFITAGLRLTHGKNWLYVGDRYGLQINVKNIGKANANRGIRTSYDIIGPGTGWKWRRVADDGTDAKQLKSGKSHFESISDKHNARIPNKPGRYYAKACADYQGSIAESNESNNCSQTSFVVKSRPSPTVTITSPHRGEKWKSKKKHTIRWRSSGLRWREPIIIQYFCKGRWRTIHDGYTTNDGKKRWKMYKNRTKDDHNGRIRIIQRSTGKVLGVSQPFFIDRKKGTPKL